MSSTALAVEPFGGQAVRNAHLGHELPEYNSINELMLFAMFCSSDFVYFSRFDIVPEVYLEAQ